VSLQVVGGFHFTGNYWFNWRNMDEKWFQDGQNQPYYITPQGTIYHVGGRFFAQVDPLAWDNPSLLFQARLAPAAHAQLAALEQQYGFYTVGSYGVNPNGPKWFVDRVGDWYAVFGDGTLKKWTGKTYNPATHLLTDNFVTLATVDPLVWTDPTLLFGALGY
jgi:hypothetical protein